ncbi:CIR protein PIR protein, fragment [Plasmodium vinckei]|uniref:CIR protein PIR protein n=1 Tax=Plasmodium vinckei TaxID=5860 RepID=A0A6V7TEL8_PLAVN|nr:CIR protein PIR protein, fragment [Plasmodium vinckei]
MAGCISLLKTIYDSNLIKDDIPNNMNIYEYIIIWLIYMLNLKDAKTFGDEYSKLLNNNDFDTDDSSYRTLLSGLSTDYDNFKRYCGENALTIFKKKIKKNNEENE